jgi:hypothetical protein
MLEPPIAIDNRNRRQIPIFEMGYVTNRVTAHRR